MKKLFQMFVLSLAVAWSYMPAQAQNGWCGQSKKEDCGDWVVQMNLFNGGSFGNDDCVSYSGCVSSAQWDWSDPGAWSQLLLEKEGFCGVNNRISNTKNFNVSYNGGFSNAYGNHRMAIVSWGKTADNCNWTTNNLYELYLHEKSYNETNDYASWCTYVGESSSCSGSTYKLYDCGYQIIGRSLRGWRNNPRTSGTTDVDCLWENFKALGLAPDVYYYFTEVGAEVGPNSGGTFNMYSQNMWRDAEPAGSNITNNGVYRLKCNWGNKYLAVDHGGSWPNVEVANSNSSDNKQKWVLEKYQNNTFRLRNLANNQYLHASGTANNANVQAGTLNTGWGSQRWHLKQYSGSTYWLETEYGNNDLSGSNVNGGNVTVHDENATWGSQRWTLEYTGTTARSAEVAEAAAAISIYPNPVTDVLRVNAPEDFSLTLLSLDGRTVLTHDLLKSQEAIDLEGLANGLYVAKIVTISGQELSQKIQISK
ncbi:RICIN domain-containing protein [Marinoscillum furvescens]|uniref:Putative secreted protein (Por secretion system target) n=1 Tax=Marinoscillum furvescens DSM 4134 TaxID=1122208 RepID=A0A3D9L7S1_MARFU|nr:RICIN domain-containing protein [Marinoscillum furvescens]REE01535.1 putative secreted protein (Por secretion system target) [Marinoscillum furvescens DSM 4134]